MDTPDAPARPVVLMTCERCQTTLQRTAARQRYCPVCRQIVKREQAARLHTRRQAALAALPPEPEPCARCRTPFLRSPVSRARCCPACRASRRAFDRRDRVCRDCRAAPATPQSWRCAACAAQAHMYSKRRYDREGRMHPHPEDFQTAGMSLREWLDIDKQYRAALAAIRAERRRLTEVEAWAQRSTWRVAEEDTV
jgi:hypothetical protein